MTHTPGPWRVNSVFPNKEQTFEPTVAIVAHSAEFNSTIRIADIPDVPARDSEEMGNAQLMAEAPEMFAILHAVYEDLGGDAYERAKAVMERLGVAR